MSQKSAKAARKSAAVAAAASGRPQPYALQPVRGQALLNFQGRLRPQTMPPLFEADIAESVNPQNAKNKWRNKIIQGDCLSACAWMRHNNIAANLVYIDPPFASGANYAKNIILRQQQNAQVQNNNNPASLGEEVLYDDIWQKEDYLNWIDERLRAIREIMAENASIYVHLDWHIGHYVKILMDEVFGEENFRNEIIWRYGKMASSTRSFLRNHDTILFYSKSQEATFNVQRVSRDNPVRRLKRVVRNGTLENARDKNGNLIYVNIEDKVVDDCWDEPTSYWDDIPMVMPASGEYTDYATQKPQKLVERIIQASSNEGDIVVDLFSGSGTSLRAAHKLNRRFIGCDIGINAVQTARDGLRDSGAAFDILKIRDGVRLFRNPAQTEERIFSLLSGWAPREHLGLGEFWSGGMTNADGALTLVRFAGVRERLTRAMVNVVLEEAAGVGNLEGGAETAMIVYAHKDADVTQDWADKAARSHRRSDVRLRLVSLDELLAERGGYFYDADSAVVSRKKSGAGWRVRLEHFFSPYLKAKLDAHNARLLDGKRASSPLRTGERGLELVECVQFDFRGGSAPAKGAAWQSDLEDRPKKGAVRGEYDVKAAAFRIRIRSIAGDELTMSSEEMSAPVSEGQKAKGKKKGKKG